MAAESEKGVLVTRDLAQRLEEMAGRLKHYQGEHVSWEDVETIRGLLREAASAVGVIHALLAPEKFSYKRVDGEAMQVKITTLLDPAEVEMLIPLFAEHA